MTMIPAPPGLVARYKHDGPRPLWDEKKIIAFDEDGAPLVVGDESKHDHHGLIRADTYSNYDGITDERYPDYTALLPAGGWRVELTSDGEKWSEPLVGWALKANGVVVPLTTDSTGLVDDFELYGGEFRIYHPDTTTTTAASPAAAAPEE